jgi:D-alanyl-D-alanine carboxypeptidase
MINQVYAEADDSTAEPEYTEGYYDYYGNYVEPQLIEPETEPADCYEHDSGYAVDLGLYIRETDSLRDFDGSGDYEWFAENSWRYGFVLRYPSDKEELTGTAYNAAHFRYVGKAAAKVMNEQNMCLEEFADFIKDYNYDNPLTVETSSGSQVLYYIGSSGLEETSVQIPADLEGNPCIYSVSGNNSDGFVITLTPTEEFIAASGIETTSSEDLSDSTDSADSAENQ